MRRPDALVLRALACVCLSAVVFAEDSASDRHKRTIGFIFRGLVDAAANQAAVRYEQQRVLTSTERPVEATAPSIEKIRQPPRPMIYIIPVSNKSPHHNEISDLAEVLRHIKSPMKIKNENGSVDPDLKDLIHATKHLTTIDKRNASFKQAENEKLTEESIETTEKPQKKQFAIKIQPPKEMNSEKQFTIKIEGDDVRIKKTKDGYNVKFSLPDSSAHIRIEYPQQMFEKQELKPQQQQNGFNQWFGGPAAGLTSPFSSYPGFGFGPYQNQGHPGYTPTSAQQYPGQYPTAGKNGEQGNPNGQQLPYAYPGGQPFSQQYPGFNPYGIYASGFADPYNYRTIPNSVPDNHGGTRNSYQDPYQQYYPDGFSPYSNGANGPDYNGVSRQGQPNSPQYDFAYSKQVPCVVDPSDIGGSTNCTEPAQR
ncbi:Hypothetical protein NTJ_09286 [Nesidiocoris tenuis]|uniref:DUF4794 domain-containing protein n=1 Tax=Nesidiocoris tenuis TaxID=355587 RepID=A0ABN7AWA7_9HEMI|nr:Hypothetical protein NTJ_09286 [Nesidiocoris tenuis]